MVTSREPSVEIYYMVGILVVIAFLKSRNMTTRTDVVRTKALRAPLTDSQAAGKRFRRSMEDLIVRVRFIIMFLFP
jgi:hypothetical protein